ncbi:MAG: hypothetical protein C0432_04140 [Candidatus Puniceispirillum sp.]|nr:hypothetical protein [Candidatus Pelagibacter sp.]MBA4283465.1 hypothetical protein [Candidatus Puniceispirillum sp.]
MNLDYLNKLLFKDKKADFKPSNFESKTNPYTVSNLSQSFSDVYLKKEDSSFAKKVSHSRQARQDFDQKRKLAQESNSTVDNRPVAKNNGQIQNTSSFKKTRDSHSSEQQKQSLLNSSQLKGSYTNFSQINIESIENQDLPSSFTILDTEIFSSDDQLKNQTMENFSYEPLASEIYFPNIMKSQSEIMADFVPPQAIIEKNQDVLSPQTDILSMKYWPLDEGGYIETPQILNDGLSDKQQKVILSLNPPFEQEGLVSLVVKDLPQSHLLSQQLLNQQSHLVEWAELASDFETKEDAGIDSMDDIPEFNILNKARDHKNVRVSSPNAVDWIEDSSENGNQDSSMNFMQQQQKIASSTITENITVIENLMSQMKGRLKRESDLRNSQIDFDIKHKDFGDLSVSLKIQDGEVSALFKGEHYEFRNLLRQNLSSISKLFKDMNLECQEQSINIIKK